MATTRLGLYGGPRSPYGSFAGKETEVTPDGPKGAGLFTRLGAYGGPRSRYGDFTGKESEVITDVPVVVQFGKKFYVKDDHKPRLIKTHEIEQEEAELLAIITIISEYLL